MTDFTIKDGQMISYNDIADDEILYVNSALLIKDAVIVQTTNKYIKNAIKDLRKMNKKQLILLSNKVYKIVLSTNLDLIYNKEKEWQDFCDDMIIVYVARNILYNKPIPITPYEVFKNCKVEKKLKKKCCKCSK